jgi:pimeloyl-ACP methyl ester carboxylesterase
MTVGILRIGCLPFNRCIGPAGVDAFADPCLNGTQNNESQGIAVMTHSRLPVLAGSAWLLAFAFTANGAPAAAAPQTITVGTLKLRFCNEDYLGYCGSIQRPLDPNGDIKGKITIGFEYYPRYDQTRPALGTILPQEGGPGYSSTGTRDAYINIFEPLRDRRDILIVDKRGTGMSDALNCHGIQTRDPNDPALLKACANKLGNKASLYGTTLAVADIVAVMDALQILEVDYYGDSYGTYVGQVFAARHPTRLRSIILDSAYPVRAPDVWFPTDWETGRNGLNLVCQRSPSCRALGGSSVGRITQLLNYIRHHTITGTAPDSDGEPLEVTVDVTELFLLMTNLGASPITYRDLDAAARAWLDSRDALPLLRLAAEYDTPFVSDPADFSYALYQTIVCYEYPLHYDLNASPAQRRVQYDHAIQDARVHRPDLFAPFTIDEALASNANFTPLATCLDWPKPLPKYPQGDPLPAHPVFPAVPTLVLSGDLDSVTSPEDANQAAAQFPDVVHLFVPNLTHVTAWTFSDVALLPDGGDTTHCVQRIVRRFVERLAPGDTSCIPKVRGIRTPPKFARSFEEVAPAEALNGNEASTRDLRLASAAAETVGDVFARFLVTFGFGAGLRGGDFTYEITENGYDFVLNEVQWTEDLEVSGTITWNMATDAVAADVTLFRDGKRAGRLDIAWDDGRRDAIATLTGNIGSTKVKAKRIAP